MRQFEILFDEAEESACQDSVYDPYGNLGFPLPPRSRPWIYSNFVQSLDGITSFKGRHATGGDISQLAEDRWLMDLLRAHADGILLGVNTLVEETHLVGHRGPVYMIDDPEICRLRERLGLGKQKNIFVTGTARLNLSDYRVFESDAVEAFIITTNGAGLVDEKFLTISPLEIGFYVPSGQEPSEAERGNPPRERQTTFMAPGFTKTNAPWWRWVSCRRIGDHQFNRY